MPTNNGNHKKELSEEAAITADQIADLGYAASVLDKWASYVKTKRKLGIKKDGSGNIDVNADRYVPLSGYVRLNEMGICEIGSDVEEDSVSTAIDEGQRARRVRNTTLTHSKALLMHFAKFARSDNVQDELDMDFIDTLIRSGASANTCDPYGQTLLHEVARAWDTSIAQYLIDKGASVTATDYLGRTPLHVAAAVDYPRMVEFLEKQGANVEARTSEENQTPLHFAARNDASNALIKLVKLRADIEARDYKGRTPLHVAAELDRSDTARILLDFGADAGVADDAGMTAIVLMIEKMTPVAKDALHQFHKKDRANRKQQYYLNKLEHKKPIDILSKKADINNFAKTSLRVVSDHNKLELITHPLFEKLISIKWKKFGRTSAILQVVINFVFVVSWTIQGVLESGEAGRKYVFPKDIVRIALYVASFALWAFQIVTEINEIIHSNIYYKRWYKWRRAELERDFRFVHQRWPEEKSYLANELQYIQSLKPSYFTDYWNYFDWLTYFILVFQLVLHIVDVFWPNDILYKLQRSSFAIGIICLWVRLMKSFRPFRAVGPFILICTYMIKDICRWLFIYVHFFLPYGFAFYMIFFEYKINNYNSWPKIFFNMFRLTLVDDYGYDDLVSHDEVMTMVLCGSFLAISAVVMLNLFIALLSDTFQRVYDNAQANGLLQQASFIQSVEEGLGRSKLNNFREYIQAKCSPLEEYYDDDMEGEDDDLKKVTVQIKEELDDFIEDWDDMKFHLSTFSACQVNPTDYSADVVNMRNDLRQIEQRLNGITNDVAEIKQLLKMIQSNSSTTSSLPSIQPVREQQPSAQDSLLTVKPQQKPRRKKRNVSPKVYQEERLSKDFPDSEVMILPNQTMPVSRKPLKKKLSEQDIASREVRLEYVPMIEPPTEIPLMSPSVFGNTQFTEPSSFITERARRKTPQS